MIVTDVLLLDLNNSSPLFDHGCGQGIMGRRRSLLTRFVLCFVVIAEHMTSNASDSESSYRKSLPSTLPASRSDFQKTLNLLIANC